MSSAGRKITLKSSDGEEFEVEEAVAMALQTIEGCSDDVIPLPNVTGNILSKVIEYCKKNVEAAAASNGSDGVSLRGERGTNDELQAWDAEFVMVDQATLFDLALAANYLNNQNLLDLTC